MHEAGGRKKSHKENIGAHTPSFLPMWGAGTYEKVSGGRRQRKKKEASIAQEKVGLPVFNVGE